MRWDIQAEQRREIDQRFYSELRKKYDVVLEHGDGTLEKLEAEPAL